MTYPTSPARTRLAAGALVLVAALGLGLSACGGDDGGNVRDDGTSSGSGGSGSGGSGSGSGSSG
ncbi:MAG: hypothetical protein ACRDV1_10375 [Actinomycetes bacterium]